MFSRKSRSDRQLRRATELFEFLRGRLNSPISVRLWDGSVIPLADTVAPGIELTISGPGVFGTILRRPTAETLLRLYALGKIDFSGADLMTFIKTARVKAIRKKSKGLPWKLVAQFVSTFVTVKGESTAVDHCYDGDEIGRKRDRQDSKDYIQFHYDISNDFYKLFLDKQMVYTCGYFRSWDESIDQAQINKLDMICRKLQMKEGDRFLDIGCGWGALICYAAKHYGVKAHGVTLSEEQLKIAQQRIQDEGLEGQVTIELKDYIDLDGEFDKISSIGMVEAIGIYHMHAYMQKVSSLLCDRGMFLNHGITRPAKMSDKKFRKMRPERRLLAKYIFPGGELDHLGHMVQCSEASRLDIQDVEGWRDHYARTCELWCQRLEENREEAIRQIGAEKYRMWILYLAGCSFALGDGGARIYQTVATKQKAKGITGQPCTREHLYDTPWPPAERVNRRAA